MTVRVTLPNGECDQYMRYGDAYTKNADGGLNVVRIGAKELVNYESGDWADVEGDERRFKRRLFRR